MLTLPYGHSYYHSNFFHFCFQILLYIVRSGMSHCSNLCGTYACVLIYYRHISTSSPESTGIANMLLFVRLYILMRNFVGHDNLKLHSTIF